MGRNQFDGIWEEVAKHETCACKGSVVRGLTLILYWIKEDQNKIEYEAMLKHKIHFDVVVTFTPVSNNNVMSYDVFA